MNQTIDYYNKHAQDFTQRRQQQDLSVIQDRFLAYLPKGGTILDFGSGSGRDLRYFREKGFNPVGLDGSSELAIIAREYSSCPVEICSFEDFIPSRKYDGIWACASLLHLPLIELNTVFNKLYDSLKSYGYLYFSLKKSDFKGFREGRYFTDLTSEEIEELIRSLNNFELVEYWESEDKRDTGTVYWHNVILKKR